MDNIALSKNSSFQFVLEPVDNHRQASLSGPMDDNLKTIERRLGVEISYRGNQFTVVGKETNSEAAISLLKDLYVETAPVKGQSKPVTPEMVHLAILEAKVLEQEPETTDPDFDKMVTIKTKRGVIKPRNKNQQSYVHNVLTNDISFGIGVAGTGKTYLAVACAVEALERQEVRRILLTRPAVEAGEKLGFLPGDLSQKVDPYLRPLYDALFEMLGFEKVEKLIERNVIEIAPLAYMRGRTLNDAFIILDESQNTTIEQMKMFLTRIGFNSRAVLTGDITQVDLPRGQRSGLRHAIEVLQDIPGISFSFFQAKDVVRHPVVARIVDAYDKFDQKANKLKQEKKEQQRQEAQAAAMQAAQPAPATTPAPMPAPTSASESGKADEH
ncbi:PhoH family protein [Thalassomonas viridans]|uniref:PhoH-like protein n=1 Tax=Thalassomonas viridans TaxID=137584 RepID=A0AAF0CB15_9GAMM|nr:PhoH family protein [Thalassomonas viridans]WDE06870.1 PhoH family protein [Thalassomonas viridans]